MRNFVLAGGALIATTDDTNHTMVDAFGLTQGDFEAIPSENVITEAGHPIADGPFGHVTGYSGYSLAGHYPSLGPYAHEVGRYADRPGTTLAVIERGVLGPGSGPVIFVADIDVFTDHAYAALNATLIKNIFAFAVREPMRPALTIGDVTRAEGDAGTTSFELPVTLTSSTAPADVHWSTAPGTAAEGEDFAAANGDLHFEPGETTKTVTVEVVGDTVIEPDEDFVVNLSSPSGARRDLPAGQGDDRKRRHGHEPHGDQARRQRRRWHEDCRGLHRAREGGRRRTSPEARSPGPSWAPPTRSPLAPTRSARTRTAATRPPLAATATRAAPSRSPPASTPRARSPTTTYRPIPRAARCGRGGCS